MVIYAKNVREFKGMLILLLSGLLWVCLTGFVLVVVGGWLIPKWLFLQRLERIHILIRKQPLFQFRDVLKKSMNVLMFVHHQNVKERQISDFISLARQLLYFKQMPINLHTKLQKCIPVVSTIQPQLIKLVADWYEDPKQAIVLFKARLNHEHADGICETLFSIFQYEHADYYFHLESRMNELKQLQKQRKESKKEKRMYVLFVLAGIPMLQTFQVFIYPWVIQGSLLFDQLK
jgi:hypothetical protein